MSAVDLTGGNIMDGAASLLNDTNKQVYTYTAQSPYLRIALQDLREDFELNKISTVQKTSAVIQINANISEIIYNAAGTPTNPKLPDDMVEPEQLWERTRGIDPFVLMTKKEYLPHYLEGQQISQFIYYVWQDNKIIVIAANQNNDIKIDYAKQLFPDESATIDQNTVINVVNATNYLKFQTAGHCAMFIERNESSANALYAKAILALANARGINVQGKQSIFTRRRPFRSGFKRRGWIN